MTINGSCACGAIHFTIDGAPSMMGTCHCSRCRKFGASTFVFVTRAQFTLHTGQDQIRTLAPTAPYTYTRSFCGTCGTSLGEPLSPDDSFPINAQCLDDDPGLRPSFQEFTHEKPVWLAPVAPSPDPDTTQAAPQVG